MFWNLNFKKQKNYNMWKNQMKGRINIDVFLMPTHKWNKKLKKKKKNSGWGVILSKLKNYLR